MRLRLDDSVLDLARREMWRGSEPVVVEPQVFDLLAYLMQHPDRVVSKDELLQAVWDGRIVSESAITNRINAARRAIGDSGEKQRLIRTVPRKGFRFIGAIKKEAMEPANEAVPQGSRRRALEIAPGSVSAKIGLANALVTRTVGPFRTNDIDSLRRARDMIDSALAAAPNSAGAHYSKAYVLQAQGDCQDAIGEY